MPTTSRFGAKIASVVRTVSAVYIALTGLGASPLAAIRFLSLTTAASVSALVQFPSCNDSTILTRSQYGAAALRIQSHLSSLFVNKKIFRPAAACFARDAANAG